MNRIQSLFRRKAESILSFYYTAGYPGLKDTVLILRELEASGADMIEIGMPFSDPLADGPVIQKSSTVALANGMSIPELFRQIRDIREQVSIPLLLMGYLNPVLQYGVQRFCRDAAVCGIDGLIIPDLPLAEYRAEWKTIMEAYNLNMIFLVTPTTPTGRVQEIDGLSGGFIYAVTAAATTGGGIVVDEPLENYFRKIQQMKLRNPLIAGFGIRNKEDFDHISQYTRGAVIGSSLIRILETCKDDFKTPIRNFVQSFR